MLGKLMKYELRSYFKIFLPIWAAVIALSAVNGFTIQNSFGSNSYGLGGTLLFMIFMMLLVFTVSAVFIIALIFIIRRFYSGLLGDEGYLMFTLPVTTGCLIFSKALSALILILLSGLVTLIGMAIILLLQFSGSEIMEFFQAAFEYLNLLLGDNSLWVLVGVELLVVTLIDLFNKILHIYTAISIGHLSGRHRKACSFGAFIGIAIVLVVVSNLLSNALGLENYFDTLDLNAGKIALVILCFIFYEAILSVAYYFSNREILLHRLNLE